MNFGRVAVLKPDHFGDLILASPAIKRLRGGLGEFDLFVHPTNIGLAEFLFGPSQSTRPLAFPHLDKAGGVAEAPDVCGYDTLISLRHDHVLNLDWLRARAATNFTIAQDGRRHESDLHRDLVGRLVGEYEPADYFEWDGRSRQRREIRRVGLCVAAGHSSNSWPMTRWLNLADRLRAHGYELFLIGGPQEAAELELLVEILGLPIEHVMKGGVDLRTFLEKVSNLDLVVATDSGTAHLCSLVVPILSLFGPSSHRRFRPLGREHRAISLDLNCSPCLQFSKTEINLCLSRECLQSLHADRVAEEVRRFSPNDAIGNAFTRSTDAD